jgi:hypothetical protein
MQRQLDDWILPSQEAYARSPTILHPRIKEHESFREAERNIKVSNCVKAT